MCSAPVTNLELFTISLLTGGSSLAPLNCRTKNTFYKCHCGLLRNWCVVCGVNHWSNELCVLADNFNSTSGTCGVNTALSRFNLPESATTETSVLTSVAAQLTRIHLAPSVAAAVDASLPQSALHDAAERQNRLGNSRIVRWKFPRVVNSNETQYHSTYRTYEQLPSMWHYGVCPPADRFYCKVANEYLIDWVCKSTPCSVQYSDHRVSKYATVEVPWSIHNFTLCLVGASFSTAYW